MDVVIYVKCLLHVYGLINSNTSTRTSIKSCNNQKIRAVASVLSSTIYMSLQIPEPTRERAAGENTDSFHCVGKSGVKIPKNNSLLEGKSHENHLLCLINGLKQSFKFPLLLLLNLFLFLRELFLRCLSRILGPGRISRARILSILISRLCGVVVPMWCRGLWWYPGIFWGLWVGVMG